jgi:hypothetical protein
MNDEDVKKFVENQKYKFWVKGMIFVRGKALLGLVNL